MDLDRVGLPAGRSHTEVREHGVFGRKIRHLHRLFTGAQPAAVDFILVRGAPVSIRRELDLVCSAGLLCLLLVGHGRRLLPDERVEF